MRSHPSCLVLASTLALAACAVEPPTGPSFAALPGSGKTYDRFRADDAICRQNAAAANGNISPGEAATRSGVATAAAGTVIGAAAGALIGSAVGSVGGGAAVGAGAGLLGGTAVGSGTAAESGASLQRTYDVTYAQCMTAAGNKVPDINVAAPAVYAPAYAYSYPAYSYPAYSYPAYPPYAYYGPPVVYGPSVGFGFGGGRGWRHRGYGW